MYKFCVLMLVGISVFAQDPQNSKAKTVEELIDAQNHHQYEALKNKERYLAVINLRNGKNLRYYLGDVLIFKTNKGEVFQEEIEAITDSSFTVERYNSIDRHLEVFSFKPNEIAEIYKNPLHPWRVGLPLVLMAIEGAALLYDAKSNDIPVGSNTSTLVTTPFLFIGGLLLNNRDKLGNKLSLKRKYGLKIFKAI